MTRVQDSLDLPGETSPAPAETPAVPAAATLDLGSTSKHVVVARDAGGRVVVIGSVFSPDAVGKLAAEARKAGLVDVELALQFSRAEFHDAARRADGTFGSRRPEGAAARSMRPAGFVHPDQLTAGERQALVDAVEWTADHTWMVDLAELADEVRDGLVGKQLVDPARNYRLTDKGMHARRACLNSSPGVQ